MSDVTTNGNTVKKLQNEHIKKETKTDNKDADSEGQNLFSINEATVVLKSMQQFFVQQENVWCTLNDLEKIDIFIKESYFKKLQLKSIKFFCKKSSAYSN